MLPIGSGLPFDISPVVVSGASVPVGDQAAGAAWFGTALTELMVGAVDEEVEAVEDAAPATILARGGKVMAMERPARDLGLMEAVGAVDPDSAELEAVEEGDDEAESGATSAAPLVELPEARRVEVDVVRVDVGISVAKDEAVVDRELEAEEDPAMELGVAVFAAPSGVEAMEVAGVSEVRDGGADDSRKVRVDGEARGELDTQIVTAARALDLPTPLPAAISVRDAAAGPARVEVVEKHEAARPEMARKMEANGEISRESSEVETRGPDFGAARHSDSTPGAMVNDALRVAPVVERGGERGGYAEAQGHRQLGRQAESVKPLRRELGPGAVRNVVAVDDAIPDLPVRELSSEANAKPAAGGESVGEVAAGRDNVTLRFRELAPGVGRREVAPDEATPELAERVVPVVREEDERTERRVVEEAPNVVTRGDKAEVREASRETHVDSRVETLRESAALPATGGTIARAEARQRSRVSAASAGVILERQAATAVKTVSIRLPIDDGSRLGSAVQIDVARKNAVLEVRLTGSSEGLQQAVTESIDSLVQKLAVDRWSLDAQPRVEPGAEAVAFPRTETMLSEGGDRLPRPPARAQVQENGGGVGEMAPEAPATTSSSASSSQQSGDRQQSSSMEHDSASRENPNQQQAQQEEQRRPRRETWNQFFRAAAESFEMELTETATELH